MVVAEMPLVPPARLAALLVSRRSALGLDIVEISRRSNGRFSPTYLEGVERGRFPLDEQLVDEIVRLYELEAGPVLPGRSRLLLDVDRQTIEVGDARFGFEAPTVDAVLQRYVSLLYLVRDIEPGRQLTLRDDDLAVLGHGLQLPLDAVRQDLQRLMGTPSTAARTSTLRRRTVVLGAGFLVGATALGSLVMVSAIGDSGAGRSFEPAAAEAEPLVTLAEPAIRTEPVGEAAGEQGGSARDVDRLGLAAEALIDYDFRGALPGWSVVYEDAHPRWHGLTEVSTRTITVHVGADSTSQELAEVLMHEVGHAIDLEYMTNDERTSWVGLRSMPSTWWTGDGLADFAVGAGDFAEAVAALTTGSPSDSAYGEYTPEQLEFVAAVLDRAAAE